MGIEFRKQRDEFAAAVTVVNLGENMPCKEVKGGQNGNSSEPLVFVVAPARRMFARNRRKILRGVLRDSEITNIP